MPINSDEVMGEIKVYKEPHNSASELNDLLPCPFCGGEARKDDMRIMNNWTGKRNVIISATVIHWCKTEPGRLQNCIQIKAKTVDEAIAMWNTRAR